MDVDFLVLADYAEAINGKIYISGGGWDQLTVPSFPYQRQCGIAVGLRVEWEETNRPCDVSVAIVNDDTHAVSMRFDGKLEAGRRPGIPVGRAQLAPIAFNVILAFEGPGSYAIRLAIDGDERRVLPFNVVSPQAVRA